MPILPLAAAVTVLLDGRPVPAYARAFASAGRTYAPLAPYVTRIADRLWYEGNTVVIERGARRVRLRLASVAPDALDREYVAIAPVLRGLGASVGYDARARTVDVVSAPGHEIATPAPFDPNAPQVAPRVIFTPVPIPTPRAVWHGPAIPRRTPLPFPEPT
ncbi:MAG TPA: hypothetical protein VIN40_07335 [Candidatus Tyrphobacter sp.]